MKTRIAPWMFDWAVQRCWRVTPLGNKIRPEKPAHVLLALCDHFEPTWTGDPRAPGQAPATTARNRVTAWRQQYPKVIEHLQDSSGFPPRHSFFYPGDQYTFSLVEPLAELVEMGLAEVDVHLHHDGDTRESLKETLVCALDNLDQHGIVPYVRGELRWAFIHGNWCLANSRPDGAYCGVNDELELLHELGCYADFTFPSAPDPTQPRITNCIYYPDGDLSKRAAHTRGRTAYVGEKRRHRILCVQGPLALSWRKKIGLPIRIDSGAITARDPATIGRFSTWLNQGISIRGRPEWIFVKLSTHGASEREAANLLGPVQRRFHEDLGRWSKRTRIDFHYVTAREMFNIARAAMDGKSGNPAHYRDYEIPPSMRCRSR